MNYIEYAKTLVDSRNDIIAAYGYGSAFMHQQGYKKDTKKSLDLIFVVDDIKKWNKNNYKTNKNDYNKYTKAIFKLAPKKFLTNGTSVIYNVITNKYEQDFKYGLIEKKDFLNDLKSWRHFYVSGRFQKPVYTIKSTDEIEDAIAINRLNALLISLIILNKEMITKEELFIQICKLSYNGDIRTLFAENPNKISNIVNGSYDYFEKIYCNNDYVSSFGKFLYVDLKKVYEDSYLLPNKLSNKYNLSKSNYRKHIDNKIKHRNMVESIEHPAKQFLVSGVSTCKTYMKEKLKKKSLK